MLYSKDLRNSNYNKFIGLIQRNRFETAEVSTNIEIISCHDTPANCLAIEQVDYRYLLSGAMNGSIALYDLNSDSRSFRDKKTITPLSHFLPSQRSSAISTVQWYPEDSGAFIASSLSGTVSIFDTNCFTVVMSFPFPGKIVYSARIRNASHTDQCSALIAAAVNDGNIYLCDPRTQDSAHVLAGHTQSVTCINWCPCNSYQLASAGMDGAVKVWDVRKAGHNAVIRSFDWRGDFTALAKVNTSRLLPAQMRKSVMSSSPQLVKNVQHHYLSIQKETTPSVLSTVERGKGGDIIGTATAVRSARAHDNAIMSMRYTSCGRYIVSCGNDASVRLWNAHNGKLLPVNYTLPNSCSYGTQLPYDICIAETSRSSSGDMLIVPVTATVGYTAPSCDSNNRIGPGDMLVYAVHPYNSDVHHMNCNDSSNSSGVTGSGPIKVLQGHMDRVTAIAYRKPYQQIISAGRDGMIFLWDGGSSYNNNNNDDDDEEEDIDGSSILLFYKKTSSSGVENSQPMRDNENILKIPLHDNQAGIVDKFMQNDSTKKTIDDGNNNWSDDDDDDLGNEDDSTANNSKNRRSQKRKRVSANSIIQLANASLVAAAATNTDNNGNNSGTTRRFVPPIIQQYLQDGMNCKQWQNISTHNALTVVSSPVHAVVVAAAALQQQQLWGRNATSSAVTAIDWASIDDLFDSSALPASSHHDSNSNRADNSNDIIVSDALRITDSDNNEYHTVSSTITNISSSDNNTSNITRTALLNTPSMTVALLNNVANTTTTNRESKHTMTTTTAAERYANWIKQVRKVNNKKTKR